MGYNNLTIKYLDGIGLNLYGKQLDFRIMYALGENVAQKRPIFYRTDDNERPYISAIPTRHKIGGSPVFDDWETYACGGVNVYMKCPESDYHDEYEYVFALCGVNSDIAYKVYKSNDYSTTMGQFEYNSDESLAPMLLAKDENGTISIIEPSEFGRYETNVVSVPSTAYRNTGEVSYTFDTDFTIQTVFGSPTNFVYEGCAPRFETNCKVFDTEAHARAYLETGATDGLLEESEEPEEPEEEFTSTVLYYYDTMETYEDLGMTKLLNTYHKQIVVRSDEVPVELERTLVTYSVNANGSVDFHVANGADQYLTNVKINGNVEYDVSDNLPHNLTYYITQFDTCGFGMYYDPINEYYVKNTIRTNMRGVGANGELMPPESIGLDGDEMLGNSNSADYDVGLSECWLLTKESVQSLGKKFNTTVDRTQDNSSAYVVGDWILGLSAYANPLDVVCDLFYLPVDVSDFVTSSVGSFTFSPTESGE